MPLNEVTGRLLDAFRFKKRDFQLTFNTRAGQRVLIHLAAFCRANETNFSDHPAKHALYLERYEGRREVWLLIQKQLNLSSEQMMRLYQGMPAKETDDA